MSESELLAGSGGSGCGLIKQSRAFVFQNMDWNYSSWITRRLDVLVILKSQAGVPVVI